MVGGGGLGVESGIRRGHVLEERRVGPVQDLHHLDRQLERRPLEGELPSRCQAQDKAEVWKEGEGKGEGMARDRFRRGARIRQVGKTGSRVDPKGCGDP